MPKLQRVPWLHVWPWAQVVPFDLDQCAPTLTAGRVWTVLPYSGLRDTPGQLVRSLWSQPYDRLELTPHPYASVDLVVPTEQEALETAIRAFPGSLVLLTQTGAGLTFRPPVLHDAALLGEHLVREHDVQLGVTSRVVTLTDRQLYHAGLHQQVGVYPLPIPHWHR